MAEEGLLSMPLQTPEPPQTLAPDPPPPITPEPPLLIPDTPVTPGQPACSEANSFQTPLSRERVQQSFGDHGVNVLRDLNQQRLSETFCDVFIEVSGHTFAAHKCVLSAASPKLSSMLLALRPECGNVLQLPAASVDVKSFSDLLQYIYTGKLDVPTSHIQNVLDTAEYLELHKITRTYLFNNQSRNKSGNHSGATVNGNDSISSTDSLTSPGSTALDPSRQVKTEPTGIEDGEFDDALDDSAEKEKSTDKSWPELWRESPLDTTIFTHLTERLARAGPEQHLQDYMKLLQVMQEEMNKVAPEKKKKKLMKVKGRGRGRSTGRGPGRPRKVGGLTVKIINKNTKKKVVSKPMAPDSGDDTMDGAGDDDDDAVAGDVGGNSAGAGAGGAEEDLEEGETHVPTNAEFLATELLTLQSTSPGRGRPRKGERRMQPTCHDCKRTFKSTAVLHKHMKLHEKAARAPSLLPRLSCDKCDMKFFRKSELTRHMHQHSDRTFTCELCDPAVTFKDPIAFRKHSVETHSPDLKMFKCSLPGCPYKAAHFWYLTEHEEIHFGGRSHICNKCGKGFAQSGGLLSHRRSCLQRRGYLCETCGAKFNHGGTLRQHMILHTGEKPFVCSHCGAQFNDRTNFKRHKRIHENSFPYQCHHCEKQFRHSNSLKVHMEKHGYPSASSTVNYDPNRPRQKRNRYTTTRAAPIDKRMLQNPPHQLITTSPSAQQTQQTMPIATSATSSPSPSSSAAQNPHPYNVALLEGVRQLEKHNPFQQAIPTSIEHHTPPTHHPNMYSHAAHTPMEPNPYSMPPPAAHENHQVHHNPFAHPPLDKFNPFSPPSIDRNNPYAQQLDRNNPYAHLGGSFHSLMHS